MKTPLTLALMLAAATPLQAQDWQLRSTTYGFFPSVGGSARFPTGATQTIDVDAEDLIENTEFASMSALEAQRGRWGVFADAIYLHVGDEAQAPVAAALDIEAVAFTLAASFRAVDAPDAVVDVFGGARWLGAEAELEIELPGAPPAITIDRDGIDAIAGIKGRRFLGARRRWFIPFYLDAGTGKSDFTWQASTGLGYAAGFGDVFVAWRRLDYDFGNERLLSDLDFDGPAVGVSFSW